MLGRIKNNADVGLGIIGIVALVSFSVISICLKFNLVYVVAFGIGILCISVYLATRHKIIINKIILDWASCVLFATALLLMALLFYNNRAEEYVKPLSYYICSAIASIFIFLSTFDINSRKQTFFVLGLISFLALLNVWTECMLFPDVIGMDAWVHKRIATEELPMAMGITPNLYGLAPLNIMTIGGYYSLFHLYVYELLMLGLGYKMTVLILWTSWQVVANVIFVYLIGREVFDKKVGLISALMIAIAGWVMFFNEWAIPNSIGITFCLIAAYLMIKLYKSGNYWFIAPIIFIACLSFLIHIIVSVWLIGVIACLSIVPNLFTKSLNIKKILKSLILPLSLTIVFILWLNLTFLGIALTTSVAVAGDYEPSSGLTYALGKAPALVPYNMTETVPLVDELSNGSLYEIAVNSIGMFLYVGLGIAGCLAMLYKRIKPLNITWIILSIVILLIGLVPPFIGKSLIEHRWWCLMQALLTIPLAIILVKLIWCKWNYLIVGMLVGLIAFMSAIGLPTNISNRTLSPDLIVRYGFTAKELEGFVIAETYNPQRIGSDSFYLAYVQSHARWCNSRGNNAVTLDANVMNADFTNCIADVIVLRDSIYKEPWGYGSGAIYKVLYNPVKLAMEQGYKEVFDNGEVHCLIRR